MKDTKKQKKKLTVKKNAPVFKRKRKTKAAARINTKFGDSKIRSVRTEAKLTEMEMLITEWCIKYPPSLSPHRFLSEIKLFPANKTSAYLKAAPATHWIDRRREYQNMITKDMVKTHVDFVTEMNDLHLKASKVGLGKALEMLTKLEVKIVIDHKGVPRWQNFKPSDLKNCLESVALAQKIARTALGLPSDEGSVHVWQSLNINSGDGTQVVDQKTVNIDGKASVKEIESVLTYDEIKHLINAQKEKKQKLLPPSEEVDSD